MSKTHHTVCLLAVGLTAVWLGSTSIAFAVSVRVAQESAAGAGDFDANVLGSINPYATGLSIADFYQYGAPNAASYNGALNGGPAPMSSISQSFFVEASDGLNYVLFHDNPNDGSGGMTRMTTVLIGGAGGATAFTVEDDPAEGTSVSDVAGDRIFDTAHGWAPCCTDGYAIGSLSGGDELLAEFDAVPTGVTRWVAVDNTTTTVLTLDPGRRVQFKVIPEPATLLLLATSLALAACRRT